MNSSGEYRQVRQRSAAMVTIGVGLIGAIGGWAVSKFLDGTSQAAVLHERVNTNSIQVQKNTEVLGVVKEGQALMRKDMEYLKAGVGKLVEAEDRRREAARRRQR